MVGLKGGGYSIVRGVKELVLKYWTMGSYNQEWHTETGLDITGHSE